MIPWGAGANPFPASFPVRGTGHCNLCDFGDAELRVRPLQDAGGDSDDILNYCRDVNQPHGWWVWYSEKG